MISLHKALKIKNRLAGELAKLQIIANQNNSVREDQKEGKSIDLRKTWEEMAKTRKALIDLEGRIATATAPIAAKLVELAELKAEIAFLESLAIQEGSTDVVTGYGANSSAKTVKWHTYISQEQRNSLAREFKDKIELLQDEVDEFNAKTKIEF